MSLSRNNQTTAAARRPKAAPEVTARTAILAIITVKAPLTSPLMGALKYFDKSQHPNGLLIA